MLCICVGPLPAEKVDIRVVVLRSYYISMNWLKPESSRGAPFQLTPTHYLSRYSRCLERTPSGPRLPKWPALHYEKSRSTDVSVFMEIIDWVSWKGTFCWMFVVHSPCVHMISSQLSCIIYTWVTIAMYLVFSILILEVPDSGLGSSTGYGNGNLLCFLVVSLQKCWSSTDFFCMHSHSLLACHRPCG